MPVFPGCQSHCRFGGLAQSHAKAYMGLHQRLVLLECAIKCSLPILCEVLRFIIVAPTRLELVISDPKSDVLTNYTIEQEKHDTVSQRHHA